MSRLIAGAWQPPSKQVFPLTKPLPSLSHFSASSAYPAPGFPASLGGFRSAFDCWVRSDPFRYLVGVNCWRPPEPAVERRADKLSVDGGLGRNHRVSPSEICTGPPDGTSRGCHTPTDRLVPRGHLWHLPTLTRCVAKPITAVQLVRRACDDSVTRAVTRILRSELVVIDDIGLLPVATDAADVLYRVLDAVYE